MLLVEMEVWMVKSGGDDGREGQCEVIMSDVEEEERRREEREERKKEKSRVHH